VLAQPSVLKSASPAIWRAVRRAWFAINVDKRCWAQLELRPGAATPLFLAMSDAAAAAPSGAFFSDSNRDQQVAWPHGAHSSTEFPMEGLDLCNARRHRRDSKASPSQPRCPRVLEL
jgi:hypothetical protein